MYIDEILEFNEAFVKNKKYEAYKTDKFPNKRSVIVSCMDTRLVELLPKALNIGNGDVKLLKTAGAVIENPFDSIMKSLLVAVYDLKANEVIIIGHHECGMLNYDADNTVEKMNQRGVTPETVATLNHSGIDVSDWLQGFTSVQDSIKRSVNVVRNHPLFPEDVPVHGLVIDPVTGKLDVVEKEKVK